MLDYVAIKDVTSAMHNKRVCSSAVSWMHGMRNGGAATWKVKDHIEPHVWFW
jgi:hypothetical protein